MSEGGGCAVQRSAAAVAASDKTQQEILEHNGMSFLHLFTGWRISAHYL